jgi:hypothetical protein
MQKNNKKKGKLERKEAESDNFDDMLAELRAEDLTTAATSSSTAVLPTRAHRLRARVAQAEPAALTPRAQE